jgi:outer membrane protein OmpA-like peptidoglycan-associated protein
MKLKTALCAAAATFALAPAAHAYEGLYGAIGAGLSYLEDDLDVESISGPINFDTEQNTDNGIGIYTTLGKAWGNGWRTELEFAYRNNDARSWAADLPVLSAFPEGTMTGDISAYSLMVNMIRDLDFIGGGWVTPYIGGGLGFALVDTEIVANRTGAIGGRNNLTIDDRDGRVAYQGIAGLAFKLSEGLMLDLSYRYFATIDPKFDAAFGAVPFKYQGAYANHSAFAGLRWNFGAPAAAPAKYKDCWDGSSVPVSSECPPKVDQKAMAEPMQIVVYFDYDKSNLTPEAQALIRETAQRALGFNINGVKVEGNTDTSGSAAYNTQLSQRRANVVRDALVSNGIPAGVIEVAAFGESNPAKPTPDGVREPLNRRTEVRITFR